MKKTEGKIRIAHLQVLPIMSGVQKISVEIFKNLDLEKYEPYLICAPPSEEYGGSLITEVKKSGVQVITIETLKRSIGCHDFASFFSLIKIFKKYRFDIIHTHSSKTGFLGRIAAKIAGCKAVIHTLHGIAFHRYQHPLKRFFFYGLEQFSYLFTDKIVSVNKYYKRYFRGPLAKKFMIIYNAIDYSTINLEKTDQPESEFDELIKVLFIGRLDKQKNPFGFIEAAEIILQSRDSIEFYLAGTGTYFKDLKEYLEEKSLDKKIHLLGWVEDVTPLLTASDIFCSASIYEAFGLVFCEAGFAKLSTVATAVEGVPEVVIHNKTGFLVPVNNPEKMAERIIQLADNKELREEMGNSAKQWVTEKFNYQTFIQQYLRLYEHI